MWTQIRHNEYVFDFDCFKLHLTFSSTGWTSKIGNHVLDFGWPKDSIETAQKMALLCFVEFIKDKSGIGG